MPKQYEKPEQVIDPAGRYEVTITTGKGDIVFAMDAAKAPRSVNNFVFLAREGYYDGLTFHRYEPGFVIQGGCPEGTGRGGPGYRFEDEPVQGDYIGGAVAMANAGPNTNGSQFFICLEDVRQLPKNYNLFGQVTKGMDVVGEIRAGDVMQTVVVAEA
jgi:peptidyl-prolyl cis-trans isomerase B (cyclophilin B)